LFYSIFRNYSMKENFCRSLSIVLKLTIGLWLTVFIIAVCFGGPLLLVGGAILLIPFVVALLIWFFLLSKCKKHITYFNVQRNNEQIVGQP
jgi:hypothetical protein